MIFIADLSMPCLKKSEINNTFKNVCSEQTIAYNGVTIYDQYIKKDFNSVYEIY